MSTFPLLHRANQPREFHSRPGDAPETADWCFCTLALGENYSRMVVQLASDIERWAPGIRLVVFTDKPAAFQHCRNVDIVHHRQKSMQGFNDKLCVVKQSLDRYMSVVFIDADARVLGPVEPAADIFEPGIRAILLRDWGYVYDTYDASPAAPRWQKEDLRIIQLLKKRFSLPDQDRDIPYVVESLFAVTRSKTVDASPFLREWARLAEFCERNRFFRHEGYSIGLAAWLSGFSIRQVEFAGLQVFEPLLSRRISIPAGRMTEEEYQQLLDSVARFKQKKTEPGALQHLTQRCARKLRYWRIKLFGLDLI